MTKRCVLLGASGLVGRAIAHALAADPACDELHLLLRRPVPALERLPLARAIAWQGGAFSALPPVDVALCALGTTIKAAGSREAFRAVDFHAVLAFAQAARRAGAQCFGLVSALGADPKSRVFYNRTKGEIEQAVARLDFPSLVIVRPSLLLGDRASIGQASRPGETLAQALAPLIAWLTPRRLQPLAATTVARGLLAAVNSGQPGKRIVESDELQAIGQPT